MLLKLQRIIILRNKPYKRLIISLIHSILSMQNMLIFIILLFLLSYYFYYFYYFIFMFFFALLDFIEIFHRNHNRFVSFTLNAYPMNAILLEIGLEIVKSNEYI